MENEVDIDMKAQIVLAATEKFKMNLLNVGKSSIVKRMNRVLSRSFLYSTDEVVWVIVIESVEKILEK
jgi:hypothetical protein